MKSRYTGIDICRVMFACLIPLLHISLPDSIPLYIVRQYVSRLGVPFFFAVSGMFLSKAIADRGNLAAMKKQLWRIGVMLCIWFCIYAPLFSRGRYSINEYLFLTPGYLWYLSAMLFAVIPFCLIKNKSAKHGIAMLLYIVGTLFGGSYQWLSGGGYRMVCKNLPVNEKRTVLCFPTYVCGRNGMESKGFPAQAIDYDNPTVCRNHICWCACVQ